RNGIEVLTEIRRNESMQDLPVVIVTSSRQDKDIEACYHIGANAFVVKPVDFHDFLTAVGTVGNFWGRINEPPKPFIKEES
ncbi:MAG: response regulator, partial [Leptonema sp. (in: Bacteria)]|nr:response regulator [Leptonema sp. (in: bacteria)]